MTHPISVSIDGTIHHEPSDRFISLNVSEEAFAYLKKKGIENLMDTDNLMSSSGNIAELGKSPVRDVFRFRIENFYRSGLWQNPNADAVLNDFHKADTMTKQNDEIALLYIMQSIPRVEICDISQDAALMISLSSISEDIHPEKPVYLCGRGCNLYGIIHEIMFINGLWSVGCNIGGVQYSVTAWEDAIIDEISAKEILDVAKSIVSKYLALKSCENAPIEIIEDADSRRARTKGLKKTEGIFRQTVSLSRRYKAKKVAEGRGAIDKNGKTLAFVSVSGFVRTQHYGEGNKLTKRIWVDGFTRGQWVRQGLIRVSVKG